MKRGKRLLGALLIAAFIAGQVLYYDDAAHAAVDPSVILDGRLLSFSVQPRNINDRVMVPYRAIGEAMGATIYWEEATRKITLLLNDRYVILYTGNTLMLYGTHYIDPATGETAYNNPMTATLDAPPMIIEDYNFVPLRALSEGLGAHVEWKDITNSVIITSPPSPTPTVNSQYNQQIFTPSPEPVPTQNPFESTSWFSIITGTEAQMKYDNNEQFILVYYSSDDPVAFQYLPELKQTARNFSYRIFGVDARSDIPGSGYLSFIWNHSPMYNITYPLIFFVNGRNDVTWIFGPASKTELDTAFETFTYKSRYAPATLAPSTGGTTGVNPTPRPSPTPANSLNAFWYSIDRVNADRMYSSNQKFILVYYHSADDDSQKLLDKVKEASTLAGVPVYACDAFGYDESSYWWGKSYISNPDFFKYPTVYYVNKQAVARDEQPSNVDILAATMRNFINN